MCFLFNFNVQEKEAHLQIAGIVKLDQSSGRAGGLPVLINFLVFSKIGNFLITHKAQETALIQMLRYFS